METRANYVLIGLFTLAVIVAGFGFVYWFHRSGGVGERVAYQVAFDGPVSGVRVGAGVLFNGIRVGEVTDLALNVANPRQVVATIAVAKSAPVRADTRVSIEYQGLTGIAALALRGGTPTAPPLTSTDGRPPRLQAEFGTTADVMQSGREVLRRVDEMLQENQESLRNTIRNLEAFSVMMARNSERIDRIVGSTERVVAGADTMVNDPNGDIRQAVQSLRKLADNIDARTGETVEIVKKLAGNLDGHAGDAIRSVKQLTESLDSRASDAIQSVKNLADNLDKRTAEIAVGVTRFSKEGLLQWERLAIDGRRALNEFERAVRNFDRNPSRVIFGGGADGKPETAPARRRQQAPQRQPQ